MKAVILVGGKGTRLAPLTNARAKPLLPIVNVPFVERTLNRLHGVGVDEVVLSGHYLADDFRHLEAVTHMRIRLEIEDEPLGTGGAIGYAARHFDETFFVLNGDILTDVDLAALLDHHVEFGGEATIMLTPVDDPSRFGVVVTDSDARVEAFIEKPDPGEAPSNLINAGIYICEPAMLDRIPSGRRVSVERETFPMMVDDGVLYAVPSDAYWLDFGTLDTYLTANLDVLDGRLREPVLPVRANNARVADDAVIEAPVAFGHGAVVEPGAVVGPEVVLGPNSHVASGARVSESVVLDDATVGANARVSGSIVGFGAEIEASATLEPGTVVAPAEAGE